MLNGDFPKSFPLLNAAFTSVVCMLGRLSQCSDSLRAGRSGDRMPVGAIFSAPVQTGPEAHQPLVKWVRGISRGKVRPGRDADPSPPSSAEAKKCKI